MLFVEAVWRSFVDVDRIYPADTHRWSDSVSMLDQQLRCSANINAVFSQRPVWAEYLNTPVSN